MPEAELMIAVYKRAMDDIKTAIEADARDPRYEEKQWFCRQSIDWIKEKEGTFLMVCASLNWHPDYLQRVSYAMITWWEKGCPKDEKPELVGYTKEIKTRSAILRGDPNKKTTKISECGYCGDKFLNKYSAGRWRTYCSNCIDNKRNTYASIDNLFGG